MMLPEGEHAETALTDEEAALLFTRELLAFWDAHRSLPDAAERAATAVTCFALELHRRELAELKRRLKQWRTVANGLAATLEGRAVPAVAHYEYRRWVNEGGE